ncbi:hypothetical protein PHLCEN_2v7053 [Hermanssonia centrifuga]|uniref:Uncharacterized protein n=1 Tax=Hermanssonia centrifuga TaxID=98765 RepID=A0A2R6NXN2_9APHY|nr:hypothetical protein PHLCEN_2v7053 [Hermanssonia centrifuga]
MFTVPNVALTNAMACRVFRQLKLGLLVERPADSFSQRSDTLAFTPRTGTRRTGQSTTYLARDTFVSGSRDRTSLKVSVHQETEIASHEDPSSGSLKGEDLASDV